jgi:glycosyltransferase involved in cell wall biosynthesis
MKKILFLVTEANFFISHRLELAQALQHNGYKVAVATCLHGNASNCAEIIKSSGLTLLSLQHFKRLSFNPWRELRTFVELAQIIRAYKPDLVHNVAVKPVLYGTIVAKLLGVKYVVNAIAGLGYMFTENNSNSGSLIKKFLKTTVQVLFKILFHLQNVWVLLQNRDDLAQLTAIGCIVPGRVAIIPGSGINLENYQVTPLPATKTVQVAMVARMLRDKGVVELVEAAKILQQRGLQFGCHLYGDPDPNNPSSITKAELLAWQEQGLIQWHGFTSDINAVYAAAHIAVLPSYREGFPRSLLEAAACGRAIITTNVPGCKELVSVDSSSVNGTLVPKADSVALADALAQLLRNPEQIATMGINSRKMVEQKFTNKIIHQHVLHLYAGVFGAIHS